MAEHAETCKYSLCANDKSTEINPVAVTVDEQGDTETKKILSIRLCGRYFRITNIATDENGETVITVDTLEK